MKKILVIMLVFFMVFGFSANILAARGGMPAAHGVDGRTFGGVVGGLAQTNPIVLAEHVRECR